MTRYELSRIAFAAAFLLLCVLVVLTTISLATGEWIALLVLLRLLMVLGVVAGLVFIFLGGWWLSKRYIPDPLSNDKADKDINY